MTTDRGGQLLLGSAILFGSDGVKEGSRVTNTTPSLLVAAGGKVMDQTA
jgi:hypothetical protein